MLEEFVNYYEILEISSTAESDEIEQQYKAISRRLRSQQNNPDDNIQEEAKRKLKELPKAKKILLDSVERQKYNQQLEESQRKQQQASSQDSQGKDIASSSELIKEGYRLFGIGAINTALEVAKQATARYGDDPNTWALLAEARFRTTNDADSAIYEYKRAIDLRPKEAKFHNALGQVLEKAKRNNDAIIYYNKAIELAPTQIYYALSLGLFLGKLERWDGSVNILEDCYKRQSNNPEVTEALMIAYDGWIKANGSSKSLEGIKSTLKVIDKALVLQNDSETSEVKQSLQQLKNTYSSYLKRKFNGRPLLGAFASLVYAQGFGEKYFLFASIPIFVLYYFSCRPPRYVLLDEKWKKNQEDVKKAGCVGWVIFVLCFPLYILCNYIGNYKGKNNPANDDYLREVIQSMKSN
jgi:tetratricopeptide (TPR) repeat protein